MPRDALGVAQLVLQKELNMRYRPVARLAAWVGLLYCCIAGSAARGQTTGEPPLAPGVITNSEAFWDLTAPDRTMLHRLKAEFVIYYFDPGWKVAFGEFCGAPTFLPIADAPMELRVGQKLQVDGLTLPAEQRILWNQTRIHFSPELAVLTPIPTDGSLTNYPRFTGRFVEVQGLVDSVDRVDVSHVNLRLLADGIRSVGTVRLRDTNLALPQWDGAFVRLTGAYVETKDVNRQLTDLTIWIDDPKQVEITGSLGSDPRFNISATPIESIPRSKADALVRVEGEVQGQEFGKNLVLWDDTGQVRVETAQAVPVQIGERVEAIGYPYREGIESYLRNGLFRRMDQALPADAGSTNSPVLRLAERVRELSREEAQRGLPVSLEGVVTWADPKTDFMFILDGSGGIRVLKGRMEGNKQATPRMVVRVSGKTAMGDFVPIVADAQVRQIGLMELPEPTPVSLEQALTGTEDGRWVEMHGYVRDVTKNRGLVRLDFTTWAGEFAAWTPMQPMPANLKGSMVRIRGVCGVIPNRQGQLTGIELWTPLPQMMIQVEEAAPADLFALPCRPLSSLRQFSAFKTLNQRVRTSGTVTLHELGRCLYLQDHGDCAFVLSRQTDPLRPGDVVEVTGFPGNEGHKFLLREAAYRRLARAPEPVPLKLEITQTPDEDKAGRLVRTQGILLNVARQPEGVRLLLEAHNAVFEAMLEGAAIEQEAGSLEPGSSVALTGIYEIQTDDYGKPGAFVVRLRSWKDIAVLWSPSWWTASRLQWVVAGVGSVFLMALLYAFQMTRKNHLLSDAQASLRRANDELEDRVVERTTELRQEVAAKAQAHAELAHAQQRLMEASRQAGMAEVATGILHNVGNVLNSVNTSVSVMRERLRQSPQGNLSRTAALLEERADHGFLAEDPKGKLIPGYLRQLDCALSEEREEVRREVESLTRNIEHIQTIVAMQQDYANMSGIIESVRPEQLMEEALQINGEAFARHRIRVLRDYQSVPCLLVDRHKVLQILVNLLSNAKYAVGSTPPEQRCVSVGIAGAGSGHIHLWVRDNGAGIEPENLARVFNQGYTTRKNGHGFGLHSGANAAREMKGKLWAESEGLAKGAVFTLELPIPETPAEPEPLLQVASIAGRD